MNKTNKLLIDGDFILWKILPNKKQSSEEIKQYGDCSKRTFKDVCDGLDWFITDKILTPTNADEYIAFLGGRGNFRKTLAHDTYKADRADIVYPKYFDAARQYLAAQWGFTFVDDMEAEDAVGIALTTYPDSIMIRVDHDLEQLPGIHFNPNKEEFKTITIEDAAQWSNNQLLAGCSSDKVLGLKKGIGMTKAAKLLVGYPIEGQIFEILNLFIDEYGEYDGVVNFAKNYQLLKILRTQDGFKLPDFQQVIKPEININEIDF